LQISLIDQIAIQDGEGKPVEAFRGAVLSIPAKKKRTTSGGTMVFAGFLRVEPQELTAYTFPLR
jgi:hypothetical protein